jgi:predicted ATP-binding protein involved in virulence
MLVVDAWSDTLGAPVVGEEMNLKKITLRNIKLLRDVTIDLTDANGQPRKWTVLLGENGVCKSTVLQCIALAASGPKLASALIEDGQTLRTEGSKAPAQIEAEFAPSDLSWKGLLTSRLEVKPDREDFTVFDDAAGVGERLDTVRASKKKAEGWFVAGYGVGRFLPEPGQVAMPKNTRFDRVEGLFEKHHKMLGTDFYGALEKKEKLQFSKTLREILLKQTQQERLFPMLAHVDLRGKNGVTKLESLLESRRIDVQLGAKKIRLPATALSDGYQSMLAWITDLLGHAFLEHGATAHPEDLHGIVLLDELDLHLHPRWQRRLVPLLREVFPNVQFIATTHSPLVVAGLRSEEIVRLRLEGDEVLVAQAEPEPGLCTATELLDEYFDVDTAAPQELVEKRSLLLDLQLTEKRSRAQEAQLRDLMRELAPFLLEDES